MRGYKVVILLNVAEERERIAEAAMGPLGTDERVLLLRILSEISRHACPPREMIELVILDWGYRGARLLGLLQGSGKSMPWSVRDTRREGSF